MHGVEPNINVPVASKSSQSKYYVCMYTYVNSYQYINLNLTEINPFLILFDYNYNRFLGVRYK